MTEKLLAAAVFTAGCTAFMSAEDVPNRTWDTLENKNPSAVIAPARALSPGEMTQLAGEQLVLCMIGDSVTWAEDGDHFRGELLKLLPQLAFAGTHSAVLGYSHAGEGGDSTVRVLNRLNDPERVPAAPYYHLMIGINDSSAAKRDCDSDAVAAAAAGRIGSILEQLLAKPMTCKVFLGAILPSPFDMKSGESTVRERTGSLVNKYLRKLLSERFNDGRVVWIEYEKPLRQNLAEWKKPANLRGAHPTAAGYRILAEIAAPVLAANMQPSRLDKSGAYGVEVINLWQEADGETLPLIPGWYTLSMELDNCREVEFKLFSVCSDPDKRFEQKYKLAGAAGSRVEVNFMTGYQNFGYTLAPFKLQIFSGQVKNIQVEKMRPLRRASCYGKARFIDTVSPIAAGEILLNNIGKKP